MSPTARLRQAQEIEVQLQERLPAWRQADGRLPPETELAAEFGVSRVTLREALASLERKGLVLRKHGQGTFVNRSVAGIQTRLDESVEYGELIHLAGYASQLSFARLEEAALPPDLAERMLLPAGTPGLKLRKVFTADGKPVLYCINWIPLNLAPITRRPALVAQIDPQQSVYTILQACFNQNVEYQVSDVEACPASAEAAAMLGCRSGVALFHIQELGYNAHQRPVFSGDTAFIPGLIRFRLVRKPIYSMDITQGGCS
jgi:GntR family transcriptional regulator